MKIWLTILVVISGACAAVAATLEQGFFSPPESTKPSCYWYWISDNISRSGITRDLEAMNRVGIGEAYIGNIYLDNVKTGGVKALSPEWWGMVEHAIREGGRIGVKVSLFNCPGWSQSGGPWIKPEQAMRYVCIAEQRVKGPTRFAGRLAEPKQPFQAITTLAFPAPGAESENLVAGRAVLKAIPETANLKRLLDGDYSTSVTLSPNHKPGADSIKLDIKLEAPLAARSLTLVPGEGSFSAQCELMVAKGEGYASLRKFNLDRSKNTVSIGFINPAPVTVSFPEARASRFRLVFTGIRGPVSLAEVDLSAAARVERYVEKQLGRLHPTPLPMWDAYLWKPAAADPPNSAILNPDRVVNLDRHVSPEGALDWEVPPGDWVIIRAGMTPTGTMNAPASPEARGLEVDKMNSEAARFHFDAYIGEVLRRMPKKDRTSFTRVIADSYEMGGQNWTDGFRDTFKAAYGYDPLRWLPVLTGRVVGSEDQSDRFLWDLRRLVADRIAYGYIGGLRQVCEEHGLKLWLENYGHWGFPGEFLQYGGQAHEVSGEFWATGELGSIELRAAASAAHIYGKPIVSAEAFTSGLQFESTPWSLKKRGDWALTEGINHWVLHVNIHQPWEDRKPGVNAWFSTEFNRHNTWFEQSKAWIDYYRRCHHLLQQGKPVADVAYFIGEDAPKMTGIRKPALPTGYNYDYINAEVILKRLSVKEGRFVLPDGVSYRLLVLPDLDTMRPEVLRAVARLVRSGGTVLGLPPNRSPSLAGYPSCDSEVRQLAKELWPNGSGDTPFSYTGVGRGRVFKSSELQPVLEALDISPDLSGIDPRTVLWTHRTAGNAEIYFLSNQSEQAADIAPVFRVQGKAPEIWDPVEQSIARAGIYAPVPGGVCVPVRLEPRGSRFVVFRVSDLGAQPAFRVSYGARELFKAQPAALEEKPDQDPENTFTMSLWARPAAGIALPKPADSGVYLQVARNDAVTAFHGDSQYPEGGHAGAGLSVGTNGVVVFEHSAGYFAPLLVHQGAIRGWAHLAVVYLEGQPRLYLDGQEVAIGLRSKFRVHSGLVAEPAGNSGFRGDLRSVMGHDRALTQREILELCSARVPAPGLPTPELTRGNSGKDLQLVADVAGDYRIDWLDGRHVLVNLTNLPKERRLDGPWMLSFSGRRDLPSMELETLGSLTDHTNLVVRYFAGSARYEISFPVAPGDLAAGNRLWLDLGKVESIAEVRINGRDVGTLWKPPYRLNIGNAVRAGLNHLEITVTGTWHNRLVGRAKYPAGIPGEANPERVFLTAEPRIKSDDPLVPFGLLGPVRLTFQRVTEVKPPHP